MQITPLVSPMFGYKSILKKEFDAGNIPLTKDITGHPLKRGKASVDHTIPKSKGGPSTIGNYSLMNREINMLRGSAPIEGFINLENLIEYIVVMLDVKTENLDGVDYLRRWLRTLSTAIKKGL